MLRVRRRSSGEVELSVTDTGPGVPEDDRERVVERFVRLENSRNAPGAGLGLSLVAAVAEAHGGRLELDEGPGVVDGKGPGLRVALVLPAVFDRHGKPGPGGSVEGRCGPVVLRRPCGRWSDAGAEAVEALLPASPGRAAPSARGGVRVDAPHGPRWRRCSPPRPIWRAWRARPERSGALLSRRPGRPAGPISQCGRRALDAGGRRGRAAAAEGRGCTCSRRSATSAASGTSTGDRRPDPLRRRRRAPALALAARAAFEAGRLPPSIQRRRPDAGLLRRGHGQDGRVRAELLQRHRHLGLLRARGPAAAGRRRALRLRHPLHAGASRACCRTRTGDGYVFRVDLRLRPDPSSTPPAVPVGRRSTTTRASARTGSGRR